MADTRRTPNRTRGGSTGRDNGPAVRSSYRGSDGMRKMEEEQKRQDAERERRKAQGYEPFRFWTPVGDTREIIIVDDAPEFFRYEHALKNRRTQRYDNFLPCINEDANCPVCGVTEKPAYFAMYLTVLDLTPYENKDGKEVPWSKKLLVVKPAQQKKISRLYEKHGTLRGMVLEMRRDGDKDASIGNDIEFVEFASEDELVNDYFDEYVDQDGKRIEIDGSVPFDYDKIYPDMSEKQLAAIVGADDNSVGNRDRDDRDIGRTSSRGGRDRGGRGDDRQEDAPRRSASRRGGNDDDQAEDRGSRRGSSRGGRDNADDDQGDDRQEDRGSRRSSRGGSRDDDQGEDRGSRRSSRGSRDSNDDDQGNDDQGDDRGSRGSSRGGRSSGSRQAREEEPPARSSRGSRSSASDDAPQRPARGSRGRADTAHDDPPFDGDDNGSDDRGGDDQGGGADRRAALRNRRRS